MKKVNKNIRKGIRKYFDLNILDSTTSCLQQKIKRKIIVGMKKTSFIYKEIPKRFTMDVDGSNLRALITSMQKRLSMKKNSTFTYRMRNRNDKIKIPNAKSIIYSIP